MTKLRKIRKEGVATATGIGQFDVVEYDTEQQVLTITVRPSFTFEQWRPPAGADPDFLAQLPAFLANMRAACKDTFRLMVEAWGGWHRFVCTEPGVSNVYVTVRLEVDELPAASIRPGTPYTPVTFGNVGQFARVHIGGHSMSLDHSDGYRTVGGTTALPIFPREHLAAQLGFPPTGDYADYTIMHELGHIFGLDDEYAAAVPGYAQGNPTAHTALAMQELGQNVYHGWNKKSLMDHGGEILDVHGVCFLQALRDVTGQKWKFAGTA